MVKIRILIIHTAFIGDIVLSTPMVRKLRETYKEAEITYLTTPIGASILRNNPNINHIIEYDKKGEHKGIKGLLGIGKKLRMEAYDLVITPHRYLRSSFLTWLTGSKDRRGYDNAGGKFFYNQKIHYDTKLHEVEKLLNFVPERKNIRYEIELYPSEIEKKKIDEKLAKITKDFIVIAPGSKWFTKQWPLEYFNDLIENLQERDDINLVIVGGKEELAMDIKFDPNKTIDLRGKTNLLELAEVIRRSKIIVTNDSSPIHIASAFLDTHIIAIFGPTVKEFGFFPWSKNSDVFESINLSCRPCGLHGGKTCPKSHFECMRNIKPSFILHRIDELL